MKEEMKNKENEAKQPKKIIKPGITYVNLNECVFGDDYFLFEGQTGKPRYENMAEQWQIFIDWIAKTAEQKKEEGGEDNMYAHQLGQEVVKWAKNGDTFGIYILTRMYWVLFRDNYLTEDAPKIVREIIDCIMLNKMTEKEKWGTDEDRRPKGELIIFKNLGMTPKESYQLRMKEKRQKYDPKKHAQKMQEERNKMPEHDVWDLQTGTYKTVQK